MSLWSKITSGVKSVTDRVTGGYGKAVFEMSDQVVGPGQTIHAPVKIEATGELKATKVEVLLREYENCDYSSQREVKDPQGNSWTERVECKISQANTLQTVQISGPLEMKNGDSQTLAADITVPGNSRYNVKTNHYELRYELELDVDVPWGVNLRDRRAVQVGTGASLPVPVLHKEAFGSGELQVLIPAEVVTGGTLAVRIHYEGPDDPQIRRSWARLTSKETMQASLTWRRQVSEEERKQIENAGSVSDVHIDLQGFQWSQDKGFGLVWDVQSPSTSRAKAQRRWDGNTEILDFGKRELEEVQHLDFTLQQNGKDWTADIPMRDIPATTLGETFSHRLSLEIGLESQSRQFKIHRELVVHTAG